MEKQILNLLMYRDLILWGLFFWSGCNPIFQFKQGYNCQHSDQYLIWSLQIDRWPDNGYIKKLQRKDGCFYYFNKNRECPDKDVPKCKLYCYWIMWFKHLCCFISMACCNFCVCAHDVLVYEWPGCFAIISTCTCQLKL
jgi:hypothetical protein